MNKTVILIAGPTAVGKTALAVHLAKQLHTVVISADSRQCFRELNIGVVKPSVEELEAVQHYFINTHTIEENVTAATFETYALTICNQVFQSNDVVIVAGGTGLYIKAFLEGMDAIPVVEEHIRHQLNALYNTNGIEWLQHQLQQKDALYASEGEMQNPQRMLRALEVMESSGTSIIHFQQGTKKHRNFSVIKIGVDLPREELYNRINTRVDGMMKAGLLQEVEQLQHQQHLNALQTVGYRELFDYFTGVTTLEKATAKIKQNTRHYAKRQLTWFRRDEQMQWFHPSAISYIEEFIDQKKKSHI